MRDSFKLEDNYNKKKNSKKKQKSNDLLLVIVFIIIVALVFFTCVLVINLSGLNYIQKVNKNKEVLFIVEMNIY